MGLRCGTEVPDCTVYKQGLGCGKFHADSDIAGIGVIIAFVSTSLVNLTIGFLGHTLTILRGYDDNAIDGWVFQKLRSIRLLQMQDAKKGFWRAVFEKIVLLLSDYQLLFGIAILVAGLWKHCSISAYHFSLVVDLAWFSNTHMTSLSILRCYLRERRTLRNWRVTIMVGMMCMMLVGLILASTPGWGPNFSCPAQCLFDEKKRDLSLTYPYIVALLIHYGTSIWRVYDTRHFDLWFLQFPRDRLQKIMGKTKRTNSGLSLVKNGRMSALNSADTISLASDFLLALAIRVYLAIAAILGSLTISLYYDVVWFALGLTGILETRQIPGNDMDGNENKLSFGQIVPVLLLLSIVLTFNEVYTEEKLRSRDEAASPHSLAESRLACDIELYHVHSDVRRIHGDPEIGLGDLGTPVHLRSEKPILSP
ncbi:MAG: hypothetical protein Q9170_001266 [Blastenia crenularia]